MISAQKYLIPCSSVFEKPTLIFYGTEKYMNEFFTSPNYYYRASKKNRTYNVAYKGFSISLLSTSLFIYKNLPKILYFFITYITPLQE